MNFEPKAGVWETTGPTPCDYCGGPGGHAYILERGDATNDGFCDVRCWAHWWDEHVHLTGDLPERTEPDIPWQHKMWTLYQEVWGAVRPQEPGITRHETRADKYLIYRAADGQLLGLVRRFSNGAIFMFVGPDSRRQGIGKALERAAGREWGIDDSVQRVTTEGRLLNHRTHPRRKT